MQKQRLLAVLISICCLLPASQTQAEQTLIAVASNFTATAKILARTFEEETGYQARLSFGSTGKLYAQIIHGAPFDIFLSADQQRPALLSQNKHAVANSQFTYAIGRLVLFSMEAQFIDKGPDILESRAFHQLAIANPKTAPYGTAAIQVMQNLGVDQSLKKRLVMGENIAQTYQFAATKNAQLGFVSLSQVTHKNQGYWWVVPDKLYAPVKQDAVLLNKGNTNQAAKAFMAFLASDIAKAIILASGYASEWIDNGVIDTDMTESRRTPIIQ